MWGWVRGGRAPVRGDSAGARSYPDVGEPDGSRSVSPERGSRAVGVRARIGEPMRMNCSDVVTRFTDYLDGVSPPAEQIAIEEHLEHCPRCVRYRNVLIHGAELLRALPEPELQDDFEPRLEHRLYHVDEERVLTPHASSRTPAMTVLSIALLLTAVAWSPTLFMRAPTVELPVIVVDDPPARGAARPVSVMPAGVFTTTGSPPDLDDGLWANQLIYDYSPLSQRYERRSSVRRVGQFDR